MTGTAVSFGTLDWAVVGLYFIANTAICVWAALKKEKDTADYFLASRNAGWFLIGSSIFASNIGAEHLIGLAGSGAGPAWPSRTGSCTPGWCWCWAGCSRRSICARRCSRPGVPGTALHARHAHAALGHLPGGLHPHQGLGDHLRRRLRDPDHPRLRDHSPAAVRRGRLLLVLGGVPRDRHRRVRDRGGMLSVLWTEAMHVPVLLAGSAVLLFVGLQEIGGWDALLAANPENLHLWRPLSTTAATQGFPGFLFDPSETPWLGVLLCSPIIGLWYWCTDQYIVQRVLSARGLKEARRGHIFAAYLKLAPVFIFLIPGMIAVALFKQKYPGFESIGTNPQAHSRCWCRTCCPSVCAAWCSPACCPR
jgi:SSS family solute:Na+ symporter